MRGLGLTAVFGLVSLGACATTDMTASEAPVPVLVGPVPCIGCPPTPTPPGPRINDATHRWGGSFVVPFFGDQEAHTAKPPQIGMKAGQASPTDACRTDVRITRIAASSFGITAFVLFSLEQRVEVDAGIVPVPNGNCPFGPAVPAAPPPGPAVPGPPPAGGP